MSGDEADRTPCEAGKTRDPDADDLAGSDGLSPAEETANWSSVRESQGAIDRLKEEKLWQLDSLLRSVGNGVLDHDRFRVLADKALALAIQKGGREGEPAARLPAAAQAELSRILAQELDGRADGSDGSLGGLLETRLCCERLPRDAFERCLREPCDGEQALWRAIHVGRQACDRLVRRYMPLALALARAKMGRGRSLQDLRQEASIGLMKAVLSYRPDTGAQFSSFATPVINNHLSDYIRDGAAGGPYAERQLASFRKEQSRLAAGLGRPATAAEVYRRLGWGQRRQESFERLTHLAGCRSLESMGWPEGQIPDNRGPGPPLEVLAATEANERLYAAVEKLGEPARTVIRERYFSDTPASQAATGRALGMSRDRVRSIEESALKELGRLLSGPETFTKDVVTTRSGPCGQSERSGVV